MSAFDEAGPWTPELSLNLHDRIDRAVLGSGRTGPAIAVARTALERHAPAIDRDAPRARPYCSSCVDPDGTDDLYPCAETVALAIAAGVPPVEGDPAPLTAYRVGSTYTQCEPGSPHAPTC